MLVIRLEEHGAEGGAERQRNEAGNDGRGRDRHRELTKEQPGDAREEGRWHEDGAEREGNRDQRSTDFIHRPMGCGDGRNAVAHVASTFSTTTIASSTTMPTARTRPNRDRLLSDMPKAARIANVPTRETGIATTGMMVARQFCRKRNTTPTTRRIATKIVTMTSWIDFEMKNREVIDDGRVDAGREILLQLLHRRQHFMIDGERIGAGLGIDEQGRRIAAVHVGRAAVIGGADLDPTDVTDARHASANVGLDDDVGELLGRGQPAERSRR